ncbi:hypothetical protein [Nostoc sp.]|uniref:hypothetical protein n=1 Tax=Nostoc sp. TaxID=1180 RepID=UPI002FFA6BA0
MMHPGFPRRIPNVQSPMTEKPTYPNFDNLMTQTDSEMQRLGWTKAQGREHLEKYYGVRSRLLLSEEELDNFLLFLQLTDTPTPNE